MEELFTRICENLAGRIGGPLTFRFILQPVVAGILAIRDGIKDARGGRPVYLFSIVTDPSTSRDLLREGWKAVIKVFLIAILIDLAYQAFVLRSFYPGEALIVAALLAFVPYLLVRGPANRIARLFLRRTQAPGAAAKRP